MRLQADESNGLSNEKERKMGKVICVGNQKGGVGYGKL